jgi:nucleotide-binding universal stress UspA family protein
MYTKILVPLDGSKLAECVLPHVETVARGCSVQNVVFARVVSPLLYLPGDWDGVAFSAVDLERINSENKAAAVSYISQLISTIKYDNVNIKGEILTGKPAESIAEYATRNEIELIIIATHGRSGVSRWVWGSVADRILRSACVPILMIRAPGCYPA